MATFVYNPSPTGTGTTAYWLYQDKAQTIPATLSDGSGNALPNNQINLNPDGTWPTFQSTSAPLWFTDSDGVRIQLTPGPSYTSIVPITGSKGANAALASLITGLVQIGLPISDQTT